LIGIVLEIPEEALFFARKEGFFESRSIFDIEKIRFKSNDFRMTIRCNK